jgi:hypothetical protein
MVNVTLSLRLNQRWFIKIIHGHILPVLKIWPFKSRVSAGTGAFFNSNAQCSTAFCLLDENGVKLMGQHYSFHTLS